MNIAKETAGKLKKMIESVWYNPAEKRHAMVGPAKLWKMKRDFQIQFLKRVGLEPQHYFLEIGCGTLRGGIPIIEYLEKGHYFGIESRKNVLEEGKKELHEANLAKKVPILIATDNISSVKLQMEFDYIWAFSVLIHMKDEILNDCLALVSKHLKMDGHFYANVNTSTEPDGEWEGFPVVHRSLKFYEKACHKNGLRMSTIGTLKDLGHITGIKTHDEHEMLKISKL
jgi:cyclopropane fatty-acyl-phospholipid synthase-like methyltransferase